MSNVIAPQRRNRSGILAARPMAVVSLNDNLIKVVSVARSTTQTHYWRKKC